MRASTIQSAGGMASSSAEKGAKPMVNSTGSGFQEEPPLVSSSPCAISRPQISQAIGS